MKRIIILLLILFAVPVVAQHNYGGKFTIKKKQGGGYEITKSVTATIDGEIGEFNTIVSETFTSLSSALDYIKSTSVTNSKCYDVIFSEVSTNNVSLSQNYEFHSLTLSGNSNISFSGSGITIHNSVVVNTNSKLVLSNNLDLSGGTITIMGNAIGTFSSATLSNATIIAMANAKVNLQNTDLSNTTIDAASGSVINLTNSTIAEGQVNNLNSNAIIIGKNHTRTLTLNLKGGKWNFVGFPHRNDIALLAGSNMPDVWALGWNYNTNAWNETEYLQYNSTTRSEVNRGNGIFAFSAENYNGSHSITMDNSPVNLSFVGYAPSNEGKWFCLANPFNYNISTKKIFDANPGVFIALYTYDGTSFTPYTPYGNGIIKPFQGFFVNMVSNNGIVNFKLEELYYYSQTKLEVEEEVNDIVLDVITDDYAVPVTFLHNEAALVEYDIFDADKMFGSGEVAEPYFVLGERNLCIESVNTLPYTATMNIKSGETRNVQIVASDIPEQYQVILKDGEQEIALEQGSVYETQISSGENAERFKVIVNLKNNVSISDVEALEEISVRNLNRNIIIEGGKNIHTEIFNVLGQKVYETSSRNFMLDKANAGAYVVKVKDGNAVNTTKIIIK